MNRFKSPRLASLLRGVSVNQANLNRQSFRFTSQTINMSSSELTLFFKMKLSNLLVRHSLPSVGFPLALLNKHLGSLSPAEISVRLPTTVKRVIPRSLSKKQALSLAQDLTPIFRRLCSLALDEEDRETLHAQLLSALDSVAHEHTVPLKEFSLPDEDEPAAADPPWTKAKAKRVRALVARGLASKAMAFVRNETKIASGPSAEALVRKAMSAPAPALSSKVLHELFPAGIPSEYQAFGIDQVRSNLFSMNRGAAPGCSGLTVDHLQQMARASDEFLSALTELINSLVFNANQALLPSMATVRLIGIWKDSEHTAVRVIAVQEALLRLASRLVQQATKDLTLICLSRYQMGYAVPDATAAIGLCIREACSLAQTLKKRVFVAKLDLAGAFDSVPFPVIKAAASMACWPKPFQDFVALRQGRETMRYGDESLTRAVGMPQGSSDSPALFPLCLDPILRETAKDQPDLEVGTLRLPPILAYQDDVHLLSNSAKSLQAMISSFCKGAESIGMRVRPEKCWVYTNCQLGPGKLFRTPTRVGESSALRFVGWDTKGVDILGVPFGSPACTKSALSKASRNIASDMDNLVKIPNSMIPEEVKVYLTLLCVPPRMSHLLRHSPSDNLSAAQRADLVMQKSLCQILSLPATPNLCGVLTVPQRLGGWGLMVLSEAATIAPRAALLSMALCIDAQYPLHSALVSMLRLDPQALGSSLFIKSACTPTALLPLEYNNPESLASAMGTFRKLQSHAYGLLMQERTTALVKTLPETSYLRRFPARDYTWASPPKPYFPLGPALATRLSYIAGLSPAGIVRKALGHKCPIDGAVMTAAHVFVCKGTASICKTNMHDCIRATLVRSVRAIKGAMVLEEHQMPTLNKSRLDLLVEYKKRWGIDFSACEVAKDIKRQPKSILNERYNDKMRQYEGYARLFSANDPVPLEIVPLIFTSFGSPSEQALKFLKQLKEVSGREFKIKALLNKIALICAHYNHQAVNFWRASITRKLSPQSYERQTGSKWQSAFQRHSHQ